VQEVLAQREFGIGRFYYIRYSYPAAIARLRTLVDRYPLFSQADEALYMLGQSYEGQIANIRASKMAETYKAKAIAEMTKSASEAYSRIVTRYPVMDRAAEARKRLEALHQPVPQPTKEAIALNRKEEESRRSMGMFGHLMGGFTRHPDVAQATKVGDPTLTDTQTVSASEVVQQETRAMAAVPAPGKVTVETVKTGAPAPNEAAPRSDSPAPAPGNAPATAPSDSSGPSTTGATPATDNGSSAAQVDPSAPAQPANNGIGELKPNVPDAAAPTDGTAPTPPPAQLNEIQSTGQSGDAGGNAASSSSSSSSSSQASSTDNSKGTDTSYSSSKKKKKHKILPF